ncbi:hypothetical protein NLG97_g6282 [Lecanicillium saksenae]|uniref:Uncharacterized protein n=1 Tax=Lecanicillium saksenae TaxID=468837 RepID=A0ACC1QQM5_9HYPO|nr:hypothetical protein NLG97_g6282 [Lecanicillium saksenae]
MAPFYYKVRRKFPKFPLLPPEIRHRIWYFCLPRRVVEFDKLDGMIYKENRDGRPDGIRDYTVCSSADVLKVRTNRKPPLIMTVCREAYDVVSGHGSVDRTGKLPTWLQPSVDTMLFCHRKLDLYWYSTRYRPFPYDGSNVHRLAAIFDWSHSLKIPLAFYHLDLYPFNMDSTLQMANWDRKWIVPQIAFLNEFAIRGRDMVFPCAIETIVLHITPEQAVLSGLFGRLGEEICQLVDVYDTERLKQYHNLWKKTCPHRVMAKPAPSVDWEFLFDEAKFHRFLDAWLGQFNLVLLAAVWQTAVTHNQDDTDLENVFLPHCDGDIDFPILDYHKLVEAHPWVVATKARLPTLRPQDTIKDISARESYERCDI